MTRPATFGLTVKFDKIQAANREESSGVSDHNPLATVAHGHTLAEAIVDTLREPLVVLDRDLRVIAASRSFYRTFAAEPRSTQGRKLYLLGDGQWNIPALRTVLEEVIPKHRTVEAYEVEHEFPTIGRRVMLLNARQVFDEDGSTSALLKGRIGSPMTQRAEHYRGYNIDGNVQGRGWSVEVHPNTPDLPILR